MNVKKFFTGLLCSLAFVGCAGGVSDGCCGWSGREINGTGQVKTVRLDTPIGCPDYHEVDVSLGVMRGGVGSMSTHDMTLFVPEDLVPKMKEAAAAGALINFTYDERRSAWCVPGARLTSFKSLIQVFTGDGTQGGTHGYNQKGEWKMNFDTGKFEFMPDKDNPAKQVTPGSGAAYQPYYPGMFKVTQ